jgi:protease PrsW
MDFTPQALITIFLAFISGVIPALIWLYFWTTEDKKNPEPKSMLALAFIGGMVAVFVSLFLEKYLFGLGLKNLFYTDFLEHLLSWFDSIAKQNGVLLDKVLLVVIFAPVIEELTKFIMAYILVLRSSADDEPLDPMIYLITTALGFAAIENMLFLINPFENGDIILSIFTGNMRFVGATLLHVISSATIALFISFHFFGSKLKKMWFTLLGIVCSIILHGVFNFFMIGNQNSSIIALELIWITVIIILLAFEKIKKIRLEKID